MRLMSDFGKRLPLILFAVFFLAPPGHLRQASAESSWSILEYDKSGKATGEKHGSGRNSDEAATDHDSKTGQQRKLITSGEILVAEPPPGMIHALTQRGYKVIENHGLSFLHMDLYKLRVPPHIPILEAIDKLRREFPKSHIDTNDVLDPASAPGPQIAKVRSYDQINGWGVAPKTCGRNMVLGMIDGAVDKKHRVLKGQKLHYKSFIKADRRPARANHGTAIAAMLIGNPDKGGAGFLPSATLYAANIFEKRSRGPTGNLAAMIRAVDWLGGSGAEVVNLSIAGGENALMRLAINRAVKAGLMMVAAAGNKGPSAPPVWPAAHEGALAVTAIDRGLKAYQYANVGSYIDFAAPGVNVKVHTPSGRKIESGTSMAAPFITAVVALHLHLGYDAKPNTLRHAIKRLTTDLGKKGRDEHFGWGLVRVKPRC